MLLHDSLSCIEAQACALSNSLGGEEWFENMRLDNGMDIPLPVVLVWRKNNTSPLLEQFTTDVQHLPAVQVLSKK